MYEEEALWFIETRGRILVPEEFYPGWEATERAIEDLERMNGKPVRRVSCANCGRRAECLLVALDVL